MNYEIETIGLGNSKISCRYFPKHFFKTILSILEAEKTNEKFNLVEDALQKFQEEMHSDYFELLRCNRDLNEGIKEMERATQSANQMYNKISIELKDNKSALKEKSKINL